MYAMSPETYREYLRRIDEAVKNKDVNELKRIREELENWHDPQVKDLVKRMR